MEKGKVKKVKRERASLFKRRKQTTRQDARNGEDKKADPQHKEMVESDKDYLPDLSWHNKIKKRMERGKVKKVKHKMGSLFRRRKQSTGQDAKNGEDEKADPLCKEMVESDKDYLPDEIRAEEQNTDSLEENSQAKLVESFPSDEKLLKDLPSEGYQKLVELLQPLSATGRDYRSLADRMGYSNQYIQWLGSTNNPVMNLLKKFRENDRKISEMTSLLTEMERCDVLEELQPYIDATCTQDQTVEKQQILEKNEDLRTIQDWYHAFVCSAKKDRAFVEKLVKKMENPPYKLKLCFSERDFLGGGYHLENTAVAIEKRCKKFIAVLSSNFDDSEGATFESHIAMSLSASEKRERYIPILIEDSYRHRIPKTIKHLYHLDYTRIDQSIFWKRLADCLTT